MIITERRLENIAKGFLSPDKLTEPFIILRTHEKLCKKEEGMWCYTFVWGNVITNDHQIVDSIDVSPDIARKLIKIYDMKVVKKDRGGEVYEQPLSPFKKKFPKTVKTHQRYN